MILLRAREESGFDKTLSTRELIILRFVSSFLGYFTISVSVPKGQTCSYLIIYRHRTALLYYFKCRFQSTYEPNVRDAVGTFRNISN